MDRLFDEYIERVGPRGCVALLVAGEHVIYEVSRLVLRDPLVTEGMEPEVQRLLLWHAAEEMEHQSVAHDVYAHLFGDHPIDKLYRARALWGAERILIGFGQRVARRLLACEPSLSREDRHEYLRFLAVRPGLGRKVLWRSLRIVRPGFRPWSDRSDLLLITKALSWV